MAKNLNGGETVMQKPCLACDGTGKQRDDEGWQYKCSVCRGTGVQLASEETKILAVDENNRLLD